MIQINVDGNPIETEADISLLKALRENGFSIPSICYHPALKRPIASCRLCSVEIVSPEDGTGKIALSCAIKTTPGLAVETGSEKVREARTKALNDLLTLAPQADVLLRLAEQYHLKTEPAPDGCLRCRLCERICREVVGAAALKMVKQDNRYHIVPVDGNCIGCGTCINICPTKVIRMTDHENVRTISIRDRVIGIHPLMRCEGCGSLFATPRFLEHIHHRTLPHPDVKEHHQYCPSCAKIFRKAPSIV